MTRPLWTPGESRAAETTLGAFASWLSSRTGKPLNAYAKLHRFSVENEAEFWSGLWDFAKIAGDKGQPPFLVDGNRMPAAQFFPTARLNFAENLLRHSGGEMAIVF